jgi:hypothetical protein
MEEPIDQCKVVFESTIPNTLSPADSISDPA